MPQGRSGRVQKISYPVRFVPHTVQPVASRYTNWAIPAHLMSVHSAPLICRAVVFHKHKIHYIYCTNLFSTLLHVSATHPVATVLQRHKHRFNIRYSACVCIIFWLHVVWPKHVVTSKLSRVQLLETRLAMYVWRDIEMRSCNQCCSGKAMCYIFWVCVSSLRYREFNAHAPICHLWPAPLYSIFKLYLINSVIFEKCYWTQNICPDFLYNSFVKHFSF